MAVKNNLGEILRQKGIRQIDIANELNISRATISNIINEKTIPSVDIAIAIAKYLNSSIDDIFYEVKDNQEEDFDKIVYVIKQYSSLSKVIGISEEDIYEFQYKLFSLYVDKYDKDIYKQNVTRLEVLDADFFETMENLITKYSKKK